MAREELLEKEGLFILPWDNTLPEEVCIQSLEYASTDEAKRFLQLTLIKQIQSSPLKLEILQRWEKDAFLSFEQAEKKLAECREICLDHDDESNIYIDLGAGNLRWTSFNLILQCCRENREIFICADPDSLRHDTKWSGWTDIFLDMFCPHNDWENRKANFILHLKADMEVAS